MDRTPGRKLCIQSTTAKLRIQAGTAETTFPQFLKHFASAGCTVMREPCQQQHQQPFELFERLKDSPQPTTELESLKGAAREAVTPEQRSCRDDAPQDTHLKGTNLWCSHKSSSGRGGEAVTAGAELFTAARGRQGEREWKKEHHSPSVHKPGWVLLS